MKNDNHYIKGIISKMNLEQKVGALMTLGFAGTVVRPHICDNIVRYHCGGFRLTPGSRLFGSYVDPKTGNSVLNVIDRKGYKKFVKEGRITESELAKKVYRVLNLKYEYGLFTNGTNWNEQPEDVINDKQIIDLSKLVAKKSVLIAKDKNKLLPLSRDEKILVIEQISDTPNNIHWHPGLLYKNCLEYNRNVCYLETAYTYDQEDKEAIVKVIADYKTVVITNFYKRGKLSNNEFISELLKDKTKNIVVVTNTPYPLSIPDGADCLIITFATSPANIEAASGVLFGEAIPEGV